MSFKKLVFFITEEPPAEGEPPGAQQFRVVMREKTRVGEMQQGMLITGLALTDLPEQVISYIVAKALKKFQAQVKAHGEVIQP